MKTSPISRNAVLKGLGAIAIGLPLLEEMHIDLHAANKSPIPVRAFNVFFGLGIPTPEQKHGFKGVLEPLKPLAGKLAILQNVNQVRCDKKGINAHYDGSAAAFTAEPPNGTAKAGGPSIDQVLKKSIYPSGLPKGMIPTLVAGTFFRRSRISRYIHSYNEDGTIAASMQEKPRDLFDRIFGSYATLNEKSVKERRIERSILDTVVDQYKSLTGKNSPLGSASKSKISDHLELVREYEQRAYAVRNHDPHAPNEPPRSGLLHGGQADPGGEGIDITLQELTEEWRLMADLYALAIKCDRTRFGALTFLAGGERIRLTGDYHYNGKKVFHFDDKKQRKANGAKACSHEWWHAYKEKKKNTQLKAHAHMKMREISYFLNKLDDNDCIEANGKTILENTLITVSTESGDGRHANSKRELSGVFHAITGANGRFKTGQIINVNAEALDLYNTMLHAFNVSSKLGPGKRKMTSIDKILS